MKEAKATKQTYRPGFYLIVDAQKFGPYLDKHRETFKDLKHRKGVTFENVTLKSGWVEPALKQKKQKVEHPELFDSTAYKMSRRANCKGLL